MLVPNATGDGNPRQTSSDNGQPNPFGSPDRPVPSPLSLIRKNCIECSESTKYILWCPCDGLHSTYCQYWPFRLGSRPQTVCERYGPRLVTPEMMPPSDVELELLPKGTREAALSEISVAGYQQPTIAPPKRTAEQEAERVRKAATLARALNRPVKAERQGIPRDVRRDKPR